MGRKIKTLTLALTACFTACALSACFESIIQENYYTYDYETYKEQVVSIELMDYTPENTQYRIPSGLNETVECIFEDFETDAVTVIESLPQEELQNFLYDLSAQEVWKIRQMDATHNFTNPCGRSARITYQDGTFHIISYCKISYIEDGYEYSFNNLMLTAYNANGVITDSMFVGNSGWYAFVMANYFDAKIYPLSCGVEWMEVTK